MSTTKRKTDAAYPYFINYGTKRRSYGYDSTYSIYVDTPYFVSYGIKRRTRSYESYDIIYGFPIRRRLAKVPYFIEYSSSYFSSMIQTSYINSSGVQTARTPPAVTVPEQIAFLGHRVYFQFPDADTYKLIPYQDVGIARVNRTISGPIRWIVTLNNMNRKYTKNTGEWAGMASKRTYQKSLDSRKFVCIVFMVKVAGNPLFITFPRLAIKTKVGRDVLYLDGVDEFSCLLGNKTTFDSYVAEECLYRDSARKYISYALTINELNSNTEILVNAERRTTGISYNTSDRELTFNSDINEQFLVYMKNLLSAQWTFNDICKKVVDAQPEQVTKQYFNIRHNFKDFKIDAELHCQSTEPKKLINEILQAGGCEYVIKPIVSTSFPANIAQEKLTMETYQTPLPRIIVNDVVKNEYNEIAKWYIPRKLTRGIPQISDTDVDTHNTINVKSPSKIYISMIRKVTTTYEERQTEIPVSPPCSGPSPGIGVTEGENSPVSLISSVSGMALSIFGAYNPDGTIKEPHIVQPVYGGALI